MSNDELHLSKHFTVGEMACPCCGRCEIDPALLDALEKFRAIIGAPLVVNSAYRCYAHNRAVGGRNYSQHLLGMAADIRCNSVSPDDLATAAESSGLFSGIGRYNTFAHVDVGIGPPRRWDERTR